VTYGEAAIQVVLKNVKHSTTVRKRLKPATWPANIAHLP